MSLESDGLIYVAKAKNLIEKYLTNLDAINDEDSMVIDEDSMVIGIDEVELLLEQIDLLLEKAIDALTQH